VGALRFASPTLPWGYTSALRVRCSSPVSSRCRQGVLRPQLEAALQPSVKEKTVIMKRIGCVLFKHEVKRRVQTC
jgi:hypothetical protein